MAVSVATEKNIQMGVVFDGEIAVGKTTFINNMAVVLNSLGVRAVVVDEPVTEWTDVGILQKFYQDPAKHAYAFQTYTFVTRTERLIRAVAEHPEADVFLLERSVLTDRFVFMELQKKYCPKIEMDMYDNWWRHWLRLMPVRLVKFVYLKPSIEKCMLRVEARGRQCEKKNAVSVEYQMRLRDAHEMFLQGMHAAEFPDVPERPFSVGRDVIVVGHDVADGDFRLPVGFGLLVDAVNRIGFREFCEPARAVAGLE